MHFLLWIGWFGFNGGSVGSIAKRNADLVALNNYEYKYSWIKWCYNGCNYYAFNV